MSIAGLTIDTPPEAIAQAAMEAVAIRLSLIRDALREHCPEAGGIVASGAALSHSPAWAQIIADVFGEPIVVAPEEEASSRGAALLALRSAGAVPALPTDPEPHEVVMEPDQPAAPVLPRRAGAPTEVRILSTVRGSPVNAMPTDRFRLIARSALRIVPGILYFSHGAAKIFGWFGGMGPNGTVDYMTRFGAAGFIEVIAGACLIFGLATRLMAFIASGEMAVAYFWVHVGGSGQLGWWQNHGELPILYCFIWLLFAAWGAGPFSLDAVLARRHGPGRPTPQTST